MLRFFFLAALLLVVAGCNNEVADRLQSGRVIGMFGLEGRWAGSVTPTADGCGKMSTGLMSVTRTTFALDPFQGTTIINGTISDAGKLEGHLSRPGGRPAGSVDQLRGGGRP